MKAPSDDFDEVAEINVVPMLDLAWNLLVVFMIVVTASVQGISVNLPKASAAVSKIKPTTKAITITAEGTIFLDSYPVTLGELEQSRDVARTKLEGFLVELGYRA